MTSKERARIFSLLTCILLITYVANAMMPVVFAKENYTVMAETYLDSTAMSNQRALARGSDGTLHCVWQNYFPGWDSIQVYYAYSEDGGETWNEELVPDLNFIDQSWPCIAIDSNDNVHVVWVGKGWGSYTFYTNIQYRMRTSDGWQTQEGVTDVGIYQGVPSIAIDSNDNVHVVWEGSGWGNNLGRYSIQYRMRTSDGWQTQEGVTDVDADQGMPSLAIDSNDNVHVVWGGDDWYSIQYRMRTSDGWQAQEGVTDIEYNQQFYPSIVIDSNDNVHVVWDGYGWSTYPEVSNIHYRMRTSEGWQAQEEVTDMYVDQDSPSIAIDSSDNVHVVWHGKGWGSYPYVFNVQYRMRTSEGWQAQEGVTDLPFVDGQHFPILLWAMHPTVSTIRTNVPESGYAIVYSGQDEKGWKVIYLYSSDFKLGTINPLGSDFITLLVVALGISALAFVIVVIIVKRRKVIMSDTHTSRYVVTYQDGNNLNPYLFIEKSMMKYS